MLSFIFPLQGFPGRDGIPGSNGLPGPPGHVFVIPVSVLCILFPILKDPIQIYFMHCLTTGNTDDRFNICFWSYYYS